MEEDMTILENYIYNKKETMKEQLVPAIENLIKGYKREKEDNERWEKHCNDLEEQITELNNKIFELEYNTVPKSKVKEKIEELRKSPTFMDDDYLIKDKQIQVLQELMEGK